LNGEEGWVVLDGDRSEWYPRADMPSESYESVVLKIHVGSHLLGLNEKRDRTKYLAPPRAYKPPGQVIDAYEKLLAEAEQLEGKKRKEAFDSLGPLGKYLEQYAEALIHAGRASQIRSVIQVLAPHWEHVTGFASLGTTAFKGGHFDIAEEFFLKYRNQCTNYERGEEMGLLAEFWCGSGKRDAASELLLDCLRRLLEESKAANGSDKRLFEEWFQNQRSTFLRLFPEGGETALASNRLPGATLVEPAQ
jgi:hypothetical protein